MEAARERRPGTEARPGARRGVRPRRRGTALVEMAMCIPLLASIIALTAFLGWAMMNQQNVKAAARYTSWRNVYGGWAQRNPDDPNTPDDPNYPGLNELFFRQRASSVHAGGGSGEIDEFEQLITAAFDRSDYAGTFADQLILHPLPGHGHFQHARSGHVSASFRSDMEILNRYQGAIQSYHIRDGVEWRRGQADCQSVTRVQFLSALEDLLLSVQAPGADMANMLRSVYRNGW